MPRVTKSPAVAPVTVAAVLALDPGIPTQAEWQAFLEGTEQWLPIANLQVAQGPDGYQRLSNCKSMKSVRDHFVYGLFDRIVVGLREDASTWVIDGGNRVQGLRERGYEGLVPARVIPSTGQEFEAGYFYDLNTRRAALMAWTVFNSAVIHGESWAVGLRDLMTEHGLRCVPALGPSSQPGDRACASSIMTLKKESPTVVRDVLRLATCFGGAHALIVDLKYVRVLRGILRSLAKQNGATVDSVVAILADQDFSNMQRRAQANELSDEGSDKSWTKNVIHAIQGTYNDLCPTDQRWLGKPKAAATVGGE